MSAESNQERIRFPDETGRTLRDLIEGCASGAVIELAPGRFTGPIVIRRPITLRGAGDLTRITGDASTPVISIRVPFSGRVVLDSLLIEDAAGERGGGVALYEGQARLHNLHIRDTRGERGGALSVSGGELDASRIRAHDVSAERGGALWVGGDAVVSLRDSQIKKSEAAYGGAIAVERGARLLVEAVTIGRTRATAPSGGQAVWVGSAPSERPMLYLRRVRFEDAPMGAPIVVDPSHPGEVSISGCDMPRAVIGTPGVVDGGDNRWR